MACLSLLWWKMKGAKVFCVGRNKTGTTSFARALLDLGYCVGDQLSGERLYRDWVRRDFRRIVELARTADAFQDVPFSLPETYRALDMAFPGSRFVLTVRNSADEWYESLVRFHTQILGKGRRPTAADLKASEYVETGYGWALQQSVYGIREGQEYDREIYTDHYERHNASVRAYFQGRPDALLELNLAWPDSMARVCRFLGLDSSGRVMPHLNRASQ
jgi:hypothetical protein